MQTFFIGEATGLGVVLALALSACGSSRATHDEAPRDRVVQHEQRAEHVDPAPESHDSPEPAPEPEPEPRAEPRPDEPTTMRAQPTAPLPHASSINGYVRVMAVPQLRRGTTAVVDDFTSVPEPRAQGMSRWEITLRPGGSARILVPDTLPAPFRRGQQVNVDARWQGGGPNGRGALVITDDRGLVFAAQEPPPDWTVQPGRRARTDRGGGDVEHRSQVVFNRSGQHVSTLEPDAWTSAVVDGVPHYFWGTAVERVRRNPSAPPPPDYVGSWLDFAIVRAP